MWALQVALVLCLLAPSAGYYFQPGFSHHYTYWAENALFDMHNISMVLKFQVSAINRTEEGHRLHSLTVDSLVQHVKDGVLLNNPMKWDLTKTFLFVTDDVGSIRLVHCHPEDHEELLIIKKAMVSVFSVRVQIEEDKDLWTYSVHEHDHLGSLQHDYTVQQTGTGMKLHRKHVSTERAHRRHEKTLHYDNQGTLRTAMATDYVLLRDRSPKYKPTPLPGEKPHHVYMSGDFPDIKASATVKVTLDGKRPHPEPIPQLFHDLTTQTLETLPKPEPLHSLQEVRRNISRVFHCLQQFPQKDSENRSICVNELRDVLLHLQKEDYQDFVHSVLGTNCSSNDTLCEDERLVMIDVVSRIGDVTSQDLLIQHVLSKQPSVSEELRRVFVHSVAIQNPTERYIQAVESFCFGPAGEHHGARKMNRTQSRACLAVGSMARQLQDSGQHAMADRLVDRLETWLQHHASGDPRISKRDTWLEETVHEDHHISKAVLLHALGNAALPRSRRHLLHHATPNRGHQLWRRAALDAMRKYNCTETAQVMLDCLIHDEKHTVRQMALSVYVNHPRRNEVVRGQEDVMLSENYTYPAVARVKRSLLDKVLFKFKLALPKVDWKRELGSRAVGASFGLYFENSIDALFRVLNGYVDVTVHDKVWAEIHLGIIDTKYTILLAEACYKGRLSYNMNIVKDFTVGMMKDISSAFDHIANRIMEPMEKAANDLASRYQDKDSNQTKSGFEPIAQAVKALPKRTEQALQSTVDLSEVADAVSGVPLVSRLQQLASRAQSLMEDVHSEATDLFTNIKDAAVVVLPFAEKEIRNSLNTVLDKLGDVSEHPKQVFSFVERSKMGFQLAMQRVLESNKIIKQATAFLSGSRSSFMNSAQELGEIAETTRELVSRLKAHFSRRRRDADTWADVGDTVDSFMNMAVDDLLVRADAMAANLDNATKSSKELQEGFDKQALYTELLKTSYQAFKEAIDMVKSRINALFGQKFHPGFPDQRRDCDDTCKCGYYPTDCRYGHPGVDLKWDPGWEIVAPVAGIAKPAGNNSVSIQPETSGFTDYEIILSNILLFDQLDEDGTFIDAGQPLGVPAGDNGCEVSHFHLAMMRSSQASDDLCYYVDPSPFLDRMQPIPTWHQECKDFTFKHIGSVVDFNSLTGGFAPLLQALERFALDAGKRLLIKSVGKMDLGILNPLKDMATDIIQGLDTDPGNLKNLFKRGGGGGYIKGFFKNIGTKKFNLKGMWNMGVAAASKLGFNPLQGRFSNIRGLINKTRNFLQKPGLGKLGSLAFGGLGRLLSSRGIMGPRGSLPGLPAVCAGAQAVNKAVETGQNQLEAILGQTRDKLESVFGSQSSGFLSSVESQVTSYVSGKAGMVTALMSSACSMCPTFGNVLARALGSKCVPHHDCLGIDCNINMKNALVTVKVSLTLKVDPKDRKLAITINGKVLNITGSVSKTLNTQIKIFRVFTVKLKVRTSWQGERLHCTLSVQACGLGRCLPEMRVIRDIKFELQVRVRRSLTDMAASVMANLEELPLDNVGKFFSDMNLPMGDMIDQITNVQDQIRSSLATNRDKGNASMKAEFINPMDHKDKGEYPIRGENGEFYMPFFVFDFFYPLGPLVFRMHFNAGGAFGISLDVDVKAIDSLLKTELKPWVSGKFQASISINMGVASAGIDLDGWVLRTGFPLSLTSNYNKQPVVSTKALDIELIPIELKLAGWVKILFVINIRKTIWHYRAPAIRGNIWSKEYRKDDAGPPRFPYCDRACNSNDNSRRRRSIGGGCSVIQLRNRHPKDPAFKLEFSVEDEDSDLDVTYAVGDYPGGTNIQDWTTMRGSSLVSPAELPCGVPLYFLVKARNSQKLETTSRCSIDTYDCTFPDGRVDASHRCSSHPSTLKSQVMMFEDSPLKPDRLFHGVGYSPSSFGHEVVDWLPLELSNSRPQSGVSGDLRFFSAPRAGRLLNSPQRTTNAGTATICATECLRLTTCVSFSYHQYLYTCELYAVTEGANAERKPDEFFLTYERLGKSYTAVLRYENLALRHGTKYYVNADVENQLGYRAVLTSQGTMVDMTPPEPGPVGKVLSDNVTADGCDVSIIQRCEEHVPNSLNHRRIVDGPDSRTVFTGNRKGQQMLFTIENYHAAANWDGFKDNECGIHGYAWAVGTQVCGSDVASFSDPHATIHNPDDWTYTGLARDLHLPDGPYYVTVQAVSDIIHGGDLVTTVCHSTPFIVDTTPPTFHAVQEFLFDESFRFLVVYYNVSDDISGVAAMEFGLGKTKYDVMIRRYLPFEMRGVEGNTYLVNEEFETEDGVPAWIRLKVVNSVGMSATGSSDEPILLDNSPPIAGYVMDGAELGQDVCCQMSTTEICAQWVDFHDPQSHIDSYYWGVGSSAGKDDVVPFQTFSSYDKQSCVAANLQHNVTYFSTVVATNKALNYKSVNSSSDGILIDVTPPVPGTVSDGSDVTHDVNYTSETATIRTSWADFYDPESGLRDYRVSVVVNNQPVKSFTLASDLEQFTDHSFSLQHGDTVVVQLQANNRAGGQVLTATDGMLVDHTPPELIDMGMVNRTRYQQRDDVLDLVWQFEDPESGVGQYRCEVLQFHQGRKTRFWPTLSDYHVLDLNATSSTAEQLRLEGLNLQNGAAYSLKVTAINRAKMATAEESESVTIDTTPPVVLKVSLAREGEEEEINEDGEVEHVDGEPLWVTWSPHDTESGIQSTQICLGPSGSSDCLASGHVQTVQGSSPSVIAFRNLNLQVSTDEQKVSYQAYLIVLNGADVRSSVAMSKPFLILKANVAGVVLDGRDTEDVDFSHDKASIAISFSGFSSEACGIVGYEWGVGTSAFATDVLPYTDYGLVVDDAGQGFAQIHITQFEGQKYYSTVRAKTGHNCHEQYIVSSSDGFTVDTTPPTVSFHVGTRHVTSEEVVYQTSADHLDVLWKVEDPSGLNDTRMMTDAFSSASRPFHVPPVPEQALSLVGSPSSGDSQFRALMVTDNAGNTKTAHFPPVTFDFSPPAVLNFTCSKVLSSLSSVLRCDWETVDESHSALLDLLIGLGNGPSVANLLNMTSVPRHHRSWSFDVQDILEASHLAYFFVIVQATNAAGLKTEVQAKVVNDVTPPRVDDVIIVTSPRQGFHDVKQQCQTAKDYIEVLLTGMEDTESGIESVELALGSSEGRSDVRPFRESRTVDGMYIMDRLALSSGATVYVTARVTNAVGRYVIGKSEAVVISPEPRLEVKDGPGDTDMDGQSEVHVLQGSWTYSDPCPVLQAEWAVVELSGLSVINFTQTPDNGTRFFNDGLHLENFKTYISYVRIRDALNRTRTAYSDGVTVLVRLPDTASVRDGLAENDIDFQEPTDILSANWDHFGDSRSTLPSDRITRYAAAVGTDRRMSETRSNVHAFEDVGLATNVTFYALNLTAKSQPYYVTIRAYSAAGSYVESSSDGVRVGFSGDVISGQVEAAAYQSSTSSIRFSWVGFDSDMVITHYYVGVSSISPPWDNDTYDCSLFLTEHAALFDVRSLRDLEEESIAILDDLSLQHGASYYVTVVAADRMGHCSAAASRAILVDTTPPVQGRVSAAGVNADTVIFIHSPQTLIIDLEEFPDPESGLDTASLELLSSTFCGPDGSPGDAQTIRTVDAKNQSTITMRSLELQENTLYYVRASVTNKAGLVTQATSRPILLDVVPPAAGVVKLGSEWTQADRTFQQSTNTVSGLLALQSFQTTQDCATQTSLLAQDAQSGWSSVNGQFEEDCIGIDSDGLHVIVRHDSSLTGMEKGAAQYGPFSRREGDFTFRLSPATGDNIVTGVALVSAGLQPPFLTQTGLLPGNQSSLPCQSASGVCLIDRNSTITPGSLGTDTDHGAGLTFIKVNEDVKLLFWAQDVLQLKQAWITLNFDPANTTSDYTLRLNKQQVSGAEQWGVTVLVNGEQKMSVSGLIFPHDLTVTVYSWNVNDYFPPVEDPFHPFQADTLVRAVSVPLAERPLCSYGAAFKDLTSDVKEVWVGVSDESNRTASVAPFRLLKSFCLPCLHNCQHICSSCQEERLPNYFTVLPITLTGLTLQAGDEVYANTSSQVNASLADSFSNATVSDDGTALNATKAEFRHYQLPTYHLEVRVVDHSGLETIVRSAGLVVDTSPPLIKSVRCFNPEFSKDVEVELLGNKHSVGATWDVDEDISDISDAKVYLGTAPGTDDISRKVTIGEDEDQHVFTGLDSLLEEDGEYYITVEAVNEAGLSSMSWCNFTVHTSPPVLSYLTAQLANVTMEQFGHVEVGIMENTDHLEFGLESDPALLDGMDLEYYELAIGTEQGRDDVFPRTIVGKKGAKKVSITDGFVHRDEAPGKISVGDYTKKNYSSDDLPDPSANLFKMEPGRCLKEKLYGVNKAHISSAMDLTPVCVKRPEDVMLKADGKTHTLQQNSSGFALDQDDADASGLHIQVKLSKGGAIVGSLSPSDLTEQYGTSASAEFSPFVVWPDPVPSSVSRWLRGRFRAVPGPHAFLSPVADASFDGDVDVNYRVNDSVAVPDSSYAALIVWNPNTKEWEAPEETCSNTAQSYNNLNRHITAKLCAELFSDSSATNQRKKRSSPTFTIGPRMLTVAVITSSVPNQPPVVQNTTFTLLEDRGVYNFTVNFVDPEGDDMTFWLPQQPAHGTAYVSPEGKVTYIPNPNFSGKDVVHVQGKEVLPASALALGIVPNTVSFTIHVQVTDVNDPPDIFYFPVQNVTGTKQEIAVGPTTGNGLNMTVYREANGTTRATLGLVVFADVDPSDTILYRSVTVVKPGVQFLEQDLSSGDARLAEVNLTSSTGTNGKEILLSVSQSFTGHVTYDARVRDSAGSYSMQLTLNTFVLHNPCVHGVCQPRDPQGTCFEIERAVSFNNYTCQCDVGYEGEWCQTETDECRTATCSPITDCVDLIGEYRCDLNPSKMAAIIVCSLLAAVLAVVAVFKLKKRSSKVGVMKSSSTDDLKKLSQESVTDNVQLETFRTLKDVDFTTETPVPDDVRSDSSPSTSRPTNPEPPSKFEFTNEAFFAYQPVQNPTTSHLTSTFMASGSSEKTDEITTGSSSLASVAPQTTSLLRGTRLAPIKSKTKSKKLKTGPMSSHNGKSSASGQPFQDETKEQRTDAIQVTGQGESVTVTGNSVTSRPTSASSRPTSASSRPASASSRPSSGRQSVVSGPTADPEMTKVET